MNDSNPQLEEDGWQTQDKKKINKKKSVQASTAANVSNEKIADKNPDSKYYTNKTGGDSNVGSWRKGVSYAISTKTSGTKDSFSEHQFQKKIIATEKPVIEDTLELIHEKLEIAKKFSSAPSTILPFSVQPYASILVKAFCDLENPNDFCISHEKAETEIANVLVRCKLDFPVGIVSPQIEHFSIDQLQSFAKFILEDAGVSDISQQNGILTWAEGGFKHDSSSKFYAHLRMPAAELLSLPLADKTGFTEALSHAYSFASCDVKCDVQPVPNLAENERLLLETMTLKLVRRPETREETYLLFRNFDCMQVTVWDNLKKNPTKAVCNCLWNPLTSNSLSSCWYKLPLAEKSSEYFYLFGFDDREYDIHVNIANISEKALLPQAKFLRYDSKRNCLQLTRNVQHATTFFQHNEHDDLQIVWKDNQSESVKSIYTFLSAKKHQSGNSMNIYFDEDFGKLKLSLAKLSSAPPENADIKLNDFRSCLSFHPFLPIVGVKKPTHNADKLAFCVEALQKFGLLIQQFQRNPTVDEGISNEDKIGYDFGCEVVLFLNGLRQDTISLDTRQNSVTGIPGFSLFSSSEQSEWENIVGYCWMLPVSFYFSTLLPEAIEWRNSWFKRYEELGKQFKVMS